MVKPEIHSDSELWDLEQETGLPIFRSFVGIWNFADREGRFVWKPRQLRALVLPFWEGDFSRVLDALATRGFLVAYTVDGAQFGVVRTFRKHQSPNGREGKSEIPAPPKGYERFPVVGDASATRGQRAQHTTSTLHDGMVLYGSVLEGSESESARVAPTHTDEPVAVTESVARPEPVDHCAAPRFGPREMSNTFIHEYGDVMKVYPSMGGKAVGDLPAMVLRTAELQNTDPATLFRNAVRTWLSKALSDRERQSPYACFTQAWGSLTAKGGTTRAPETAEEHNRRVNHVGESYEDYLKRKESDPWAKGPKI